MRKKGTGQILPCALDSSFVKRALRAAFVKRRRKGGGPVSGPVRGGRTCLPPPRISAGQKCKALLTSALPCAPRPASRARGQETRLVTGDVVYAGPSRWPSFSGRPANTKSAQNIATNHLRPQGRQNIRTALPKRIMSVPSPALLARRIVLPVHEWYKWYDRPQRPQGLFNHHQAKGGRDLRSCVFATRSRTQ